MSADLDAAQAAALAQAARALSSGNPAAALKALQAVPDTAVAWQIRGLALRAQGDRAGAEAALLKALQLAPDHPATMAQLAQLAAERDAPQEALGWLERLLALQPDNPAVLGSYGGMLRRMDRAAEALPVLDRALTLQPDHAGLLLDRAHALRKLQRLAEAKQAFEAALASQPQAVAAWTGLAECLLRQHDAEGAMQAIAKALALAPGDGQAIGTKGLILAHRGDRVAALECYRQAYAAMPNEVSARRNYGNALLRAGHVAEAWPLLEHRPDRPESRAPLARAGLPYWDGADVPGLRLLIWAEQGIGDEILQAGYVPELLAAGIDLVLLCSARLEPLFRRAFKGADIHAVRADTDLRVFGATHQISICDLASRLRRMQAAPAQDVPYLRADPLRSQIFAQRYRSLQAERVIGLSWRSGNPALGDSKSLRLVDLLPILRLPGVAFVSLQYGDCADEIAALHAQHGIALHVDADVDPLSDIDGQAAQISALDAVVSISTAVVHLACALAVPSRVLLPFEHGLLWYWGESGDASIWRPGAKLYRPANADDRLSPIQALAADMQAGRA
ncbi:tetratricopeptide repeat protein [Ferrovibrio sp.]|uniref:tetratricopeptide repeat protein n=1 Tax=Ferrovibrio sp. TaxID=1917215 RepID=UPI0025C36567|nr:tetratricopeptide repeat protein [Ferrovibrio sp.]MBX3454122.1 tetratricopeptide repeat protein [Ferrovibrio sp.]